MKLVIRSLRWIQKCLSRFTAPSQAELVFNLCVRVMSLELQSHEYVEFAPLKLIFGPFKIYGGGLPVCEYVMFDRNTMEFLKVKVEIGRPDKLTYRVQIESIRLEDSSRHGEIVPIKPEHRVPFETLIRHLYSYFPYHRTKEDRPLGIQVVEGSKID